MSADRDIPALTSIEAQLAEQKKINAKQLELNAAQVQINSVVFERLKVLEDAGKPPSPIPPDPPVITPPIVTPPPVVTPPIVVTDPVIPVPPPNALNTANFPGDDVGAKLRAADEQLGDRQGAIIVQAGTIATQVMFRPKRSLYFVKGEFPIVVPNQDQCNLIINDHTDIYGQGTKDGEGTFFIEPTNGYVIIQSRGSWEKVNWWSDALVTSDIDLGWFGILGKNTVPEGGVRSSIKLGNAHTVSAYRLLLRDTSCLGITAGGNALSGFHAEGWDVSECDFEGVASQALNVVNGRDVLFELNRFKRSGKFPSMGMSPIDVEPNDHGDWARNITIRKNKIDSTDSTFQHGNGIVVQNENLTTDFGPILVEDNEIAGGNKLYTAYMVFGSVANVTLRRNTAKEVLHSLYRFENADRITMEDNGGVGKGRSGSESVEIELINNVNNSTFKRNKLTLAPGEAGPMRFLERGNCHGNVFEDNDPKAVRVA